MSKIYLKVKIKSLAAEARIIRHEEHRARKYDVDGAPSLLFWGLRSHRTCDVRREARASLLAYGFLRGRTYALMEAKSYDDPPMSRVAELVKKYGLLKPPPNRSLADLLGDWQKGEIDTLTRLAA